MRTVIYARVSQDQTGEGRSVDQQIAELRAEIERRGWTLVATHSDNSISASRHSRAARPGWEQRRGEALACAVGDVDLSARTLRITVSKTRSRLLPLSGRAAAYLDRWLRSRPDAKDHEPLWTAAGTGKALGASGARLALARRCKTAGIRALNPHSFRHQFADTWLAAGGSELALQDLAGWSSGAMLKVYARQNRQARAHAEYGRLMG